MVPTPIILALLIPMYPMPTYYTDSTCDFVGVQHEQLQKLCAQKIPDLMFFYHLEILKLFNKRSHIFNLHMGLKMMQQTLCGAEENVKWSYPPPQHSQ